MPRPPPAGDEPDPDAVTFQLADEFGYPIKRGTEGLGSLDLGADVHADPDGVKVTRSLHFLVTQAGRP